MTGISRAAYVAAALSVIVGFGTGGAPAQADAPETVGVICAFAPLVDPSPQEGTRLAELSGGPVLLTEADGVTPARGTVICRIQVYGSTQGPNVAARGTGAFVANPAVVRYAADDWDYVFLCSEFVDDKDGVRYYWDDELGEWSTSPATPCSLTNARSASDDDPEPIEYVIDSVVCPIFALVFPPEGDIERVWDCPPYGNVEPLPGPPPTPSVLGCDDGLDNDADGLADYPADPGCASPADTDEHSFAPCDDGADNDGDRAADYPRDPGCASPADLDERGTTACDDGLDNDGDGARDYLLDPGCSSPADTDEESFP